MITSIGLDHQQFLGNTLEQIAAEKAGIIKSIEPVVIGPEAEFDVDPGACRRTPLRDRSIFRGKLVRWAAAISISISRRRYASTATFGLRFAGRHQLDNVVVAIRAAECLKLSREQIEQGVNTAVWPGRLEQIPGSSVVSAGRRAQRHGDACALRALARVLSRRRSP